MNSPIAINTLSVSSNQKHISKSAAQAMASRHTCPCCSSVLLRHARSGEIYWRCSTCYQEMPA